MPEMADDALRSMVEGISKRLQDELEARLGELNVRHQDQIEDARRAAEAEAEQRWSAKVEDVRAEWTTRLESEISAARSDYERRMVAESMRLRVESEQAAAESRSRVRQELEVAINRERAQAQTELIVERQRLTTDRDRLLRELEDGQRQFEELSKEIDNIRSLQARTESALQEERQGREADARQQEEIAAAAAEARIAERQTQLAVVERLLIDLRSLDAARSLSQVLSALLASAAGEAPRVALFVANGTVLKAWKAEGFDADVAALRLGTEEDGLLAEVLRRGEPVVTSADSGPAAPAFASLPDDRAAMAVPLLVGAQPVAVLYADDAGDGPKQVPASWPEAIQILCRHASVNLAHLTATRAADSMRRSMPAPAARGAGGEAVPEDSNSARRYARLLVSEIKLYNEPAVRLGRQKRDLLTRLKPEIDRARQLYEQRISSAIESRGALFHQELVQTLADGDPALLGGSA